MDQLDIDKIVSDAASPPITNPSGMPRVTIAETKGNTPAEDAPAKDMSQNGTSPNPLMALREGLRLPPESDENMSQDALKYLRKHEFFNISRSLTIDDIKDMHIFITEHPDDVVHKPEKEDKYMRAGQFRDINLSIYGTVMTCPPGEISAQMTRFIEWLNMREREISINEAARFVINRCKQSDFNKSGFLVAVGGSHS